MHELSIAMSIVEMAQEEAERRGGVQVHAVHLQLGLLTGVVKEALLSSYEMACFATPLEGSQIVIEEIPIEVYCPKCAGRASAFVRFSWFCCPECGTPTIRSFAGERDGSGRAGD